MDKQILKMSQIDLDQYLETQGANYFRLESELLSDIEQKQNSITTIEINFVQEISKALAIFAGFGFTAVQFSCLMLFFFGEVVLFSGIFWGMYWTRKVLESKNKLWNERAERFSNAFEKRKKIYFAVRDQLLNSFDGKHYSLKTDDQKKLEDANKILKEEVLNESLNRKFDSPIPILITTGAIGVSLLLAGILLT